MAEANRADPMVGTESITVDPEVLTAIQRGIAAADEGHFVSSEDIRKLIPQWISKLPKPNQR